MKKWIYDQGIVRMIWNKILHWKGQKVSFICFSLCITLNKPVSSPATKTRAPTLACVRLRAVSYLIESRGDEERALISAPISPPFQHNLHNFTFSLTARGSEETRRTAQGLVLLLLLFPCSQTELSDATIFYPYQSHYRQGNTISFPEQWYA